MQVVKEFELVLDQPAFVKVSTPDGSSSARIDVYAARRALERAEAKPTEEERWCDVREYLAEQLDCSIIDDLPENVAIGFNNYVCAIIAALEDARKKKAESIASNIIATACSPTFTQVSPKTSAPGRKKTSKRGSKTSRA